MDNKMKYNKIVKVIFKNGMVKKLYAGYFQNIIMVAFKKQVLTYKYL